MKTFLAIVLATLTPLLSAQSNNANVKVRVAVIDKELNVKPVPKFGVTLQSGSGGAPIAMTTGFDGVAAAEVPPGNYRLTTAHPVEFQGKQYSWELDISVKAGENLIELSNDNAKTTETAQKPSRITDELAEHFKHFQNSVVTVWSETGHGTGFLIDPKGLVVTNGHVVVGSNLFSVQFDPQRKVSAVLLAYDGPRDVAVLWANFANIPEASPAPLLAKGESPVVEGEKVFTIGSPLNQRKIISTGIVGKLEERAIISDIHIDHGSSGGPLFNSLGVVAGLTTFGEGRAVSGIVRIEEAFPVIEQAKTGMKSAAAPRADLLPVEPPGTFPLEALKDVFNRPKFDTHPYRFEAGDYEVLVMTPPLDYYLKEFPAVEAAKQKEKRTKKGSESVRQTSDLLPEIENWMEYVGEYSPVIMVQAQPKLKETTGSKWRRGLIAGLSHGMPSVATLRFKTDFYRMQLKCGDKEITPIQPGRYSLMHNEKNQIINAVDATYGGIYSYPPDALSPACGQVTLELYSEKNPASATTKTLEAKTVSTVWDDFAPYRAYNVSARKPAYENASGADAPTKQWDEAIRLNPSDPQAFNNRGVAYANDGNYDSAIQDYGQAIRLKPDFAYAFGNRGVAYLSKSDYNHAIQDLTEAVRLNPQYAYAFYNRGLAYGHTGENDRAIEDFSEAIRLKPNYAEAFQHRGEIKQNKGDSTGADADFVQAKELGAKSNK